MRRFKLHEPASVPEASQLLSQYGDGAKAFAGGTELLMLVKLGVLHPEHLINLKGVQGLKGIGYDKATGWLSIGALATHRDVELSPVVQEHLPVFSQMERDVANVRVRNMGTIAGNLCFADPYSDPGTLLTCLKAELVLQRGRQRRIVPIDSFFVDAYSTSREEDEILVEIKVPPLPARSAMAYETFKFYERPAANVAVMAAAGDGGGTGLTVAFGAAAPTPTRLEPIKVDGRGDPEGAAQEAVEKARKAIDDLDLLEDFHGSKEYKRNLLRGLLRRAVVSAVAGARSRK